jgi:hypothetical protein
MNTIDFKNSNYQISHVEMNDNCDIIIIHLYDAPFKYKLMAEGDCCSTSIFKKYRDYDFTQLSGKIIKKIKSINIPDDYIDSDVDNNDDSYQLNDVATPHLYEIRFKNSDDLFQFQMINFSNGYYDGWMSSSIVV